MTITVNPSTYDRFVSTFALDTWPYWRAPSTGRLHRVTGIHLVWRGPGASYLRPRPIVRLECLSLWPPISSKLHALTGERGGDECRKCFREAS